MEMVIVLAVISILATMATPSIRRSYNLAMIREDARQLRKDISQMRLSSIREGKVKWGTFYSESVVCYPNGQTSSNWFTIKHDKYYVNAKLRGFTGKVTFEKPKPIK